MRTEILLSMRKIDPLLLYTKNRAQRISLITISIKISIMKVKNTTNINKSKLRSITPSRKKLSAKDVSQNRLKEAEIKWGQQKSNLLRN